MTAAEMTSIAISKHSPVQGTAEVSNWNFFLLKCFLTLHVRGYFFHFVYRTQTSAYYTCIVSLAEWSALVAQRS